VFERLERDKKSIYVARQIIKGIQDGRFRLGDRIPPEQVIAEEIGVSRTAVREALVALEMAGVLERRAGDGTYITGFLPVSFAQAIEILQEDGNTIEIIEARALLEPCIVDLVCERASEAEIATLYPFVERMDRAVKSSDVDGFIEGDYLFHSQLAKLSKNSILEGIMEQLLFLMRKHLWRYIKEKCLREKKRWAESAEIHRVIADALKAKDLSEAKRAVSKHFEDIFKLL